MYIDSTLVTPCLIPSLVSWSHPVGGDYDVTIPCDTPAGEYSVRVGRFEDPSLYACSAPFMVIAKEDSADSSDDESMSYSF